MLMADPKAWKARKVKLENSKCSRAVEVKYFYGSKIVVSKIVVPRMKNFK